MSSLRSIYDYNVFVESLYVCVFVSSSMCVFGYDDTRASV